MLVLSLRLTVLMAIGPGLIMDGHGFQALPGAGHHFIMADGTMKAPMAGTGYPITNGGLPGLNGLRSRVIMAGHHLGQVSVLT